MKKIIVNDFIKESKILLFFLDDNKSFATLLMRIFIVITIPTLIITFIAYLNNVLIINGVDSLGREKIGLFEDFVFISFALSTSPFFIIILRVIIRRFIFFISEIPSFTSNLDTEKQDLLTNKYLQFVTKRNLTLNVIKYSFVIISFYSNTSAIFFREGGWNSPSHPEVFIAVVLFFGLNAIILPEVLLKYIMIIICQIKMTKELEKDNLIEIKPIAPDKSGGLRSLGELSLAFTYFLVPIMIQLIAHYFTWRRLNLGFILGLAGVIPLTTFVFFYPLGVVHKVMAEAKRSTLTSISNKYLSVNRSILNNLNAAENDISLSSKKEIMELLENLYTKAENMPVWPFNLKTLSHFFAIAFGPVILILFELIIQKILSKYIF